MNKKPLVSVAITSYNQNLFLIELIESVLAQNFKDIEIVISDDGSTDESHQTLLDYDRKYPNKFNLILASENIGLPKNTDRTLRACKGKYIAWMGGGDDLMLPNKLSKQVDFMEKNPDCYISYHDVDIFDSKTNQSLGLFSRTNVPREGDITCLIKYGSINCSCSTMLRADCLPKEGVNERLLAASEWLYYVECLRDGGKIKYINEVLGKYRRHENNMTGSLPNTPHIRGLQDLLVSCALLKSIYPEYKSIIDYRESSIFRELRFRNNGEKYINYLLISLKTKFNLKALYGIAYYITLRKKL